MVREVNKKGKKYFECIECGFFYDTKELAEKCEEFCRKNKACNIEITKYAVRI